MKKATCLTSPGHVPVDSRAHGYWDTAGPVFLAWGPASARGLARSSGVQLGLRTWVEEWQCSEGGDKVEWKTSGNSSAGGQPCPPLSRPCRWLFSPRACPWHCFAVRNNGFFSSAYPVPGDVLTLCGQLAHRICTA